MESTDKLSKIKLLSFFGNKVRDEDSEFLLKFTQQPKMAMKWLKAAIRND